MNTTRHTGWTAALAAMAFGPALAGEPLAETLDDRAPAWLETHGVPALGVAVVRDGELAATRVYGMQAKGIPAIEATVFNVASMAKPVAAETVLRLAASGRLALDEPMKRFWRDPDIVDDPWTDLLTPLVAMTHETGFANWRRQTGGELTFQFMPGTKASYSGEGFEYLGRFVEKKTGRNFEAVVNREVFEPLGMKDTAMSERAWFAARVTPPHDEVGQPLPLQVSDPWSAADDLHTTPRDYGLFLAAVARGDGVGEDLHALRLEPGIDQFADGCPLPAPACPDSGGFSAGWAVFDYGDRSVIFQGGGDEGIRTMAFFDPETKDGLVILTNSANGSSVIARVGEAADVPEGFKAFLRIQAGEAP